MQDVKNTTKMKLCNVLGKKSTIVELMGRAFCLVCREAVGLIPSTSKEMLVNSSLFVNSDSVLVLDI